MKAAPLSQSTPRRGSFASDETNETARSLADRACDIHGKSRAQVLESGGRVDKGTWRSPELGRNRRQRTQHAHRARSDTEADCGGLKLSAGRASNPGCRGYDFTGIPVRER